MPGALEGVASKRWRQLERVAHALRSLGDEPMTQERVERLTRRQGSVKNFAVENWNGERLCVSLPMQLRQRQRLLATVSHVLRWPT
jgi:hypothetical protein